MRERGGYRKKTEREEGVVRQRTCSSTHLVSPASPPCADDAGIPSCSIDRAAAPACEKREREREDVVGDTVSE
jgi:hypothetical protein